MFADQNMACAPSPSLGRFRWENVAYRGSCFGICADGTVKRFDYLGELPTIRPNPLTSKGRKRKWKTA